MARRIGKVTLVTAAMMLTAPTLLSAQQGQPKQPPAAAPANPGAAAIAAPVATLPDPYKLNMMIRTAVIALNQANQTGNYTVLRDLGAASFRGSNDASRLAEIFADLRKRKLDLSPVLFFMPKLVQQPQINERGVIRLVGYFETAPERINFDVYYLFEAGQWRLFGIGVLLSPAVDATAALPQQNNAAPAAAPGAAAPTGAPAKPAAASAGRASPKPPGKSSENSAPASPGKPEKAAAENKATNNPARIQLGAPTAATASPEPAPGGTAQSEAERPAPTEKKDGFLSFW